LACGTDVNGPCRVYLDPGRQQKQITSWGDLRNKAAHGQYDKYDEKQVRMMLLFVEQIAADRTCVNHNRECGVWIKSMSAHGIIGFVAGRMSRTTYMALYMDANACASPSIYAVRSVSSGPATCSLPRRTSRTPGVVGFLVEPWGGHSPRRCTSRR